MTTDGGASITARGVCWGTSHNPTISSSHTSNGSGTGSFTSTLTGLTAGTTYYVRSYATNSSGTAYSSETSFTTDTVAMPELNITVNPRTTSQLVGDPVIFDIQLSNIGESDALDTTVSIPIPNNAEFVSASMTGWQDNALVAQPDIDVTDEMVTLSFDVVPVGKTALIEFVVRATSKGAISVTASTQDGIQSTQALDVTDVAVEVTDRIVEHVTGLCGSGTEAAMLEAMMLIPVLTLATRWRRRRYRNEQ